MTSAGDLYWAAREGNLALQEELKKCANINHVKDSNGWTALHWAAYKGDVQATQVLISNSANVDEKNKSGQTPLHIAAKDGNNNVIKVLLDNSSCISEVDNDKNTPLHLALAHSGDLDTVKLLLQNSEDVKSLVNTANKNQQTPLHIAAQHGKNSVIKVLLNFPDNSSCVSELDNDKNTPLHLALAFSGDLDTVKLLLQHSENVKSLVDAVNENQETALHLAVNKKSSELVKLLVENFSNSNAFDKNKNTPFHLEINGKCDFSVIKLMLEHSEDVKSLVNAVNENQQTPLHLTAKKGKNSVTKLLLEKSSCVRAVDKDMNTPLHLCLAHGGNLDTVKLLLQHSEDVKHLVNAANENQETALHLAVNKDLEIVRLLVENSSFVSAENKDKKRPLDLAIQNQKRNVAELLTRFDVLQKIGFTINPDQDPENLNSLVIFDDFSAIEHFLKVSLRFYDKGPFS